MSTLQVLYVSHYLVFNNRHYEETGGCTHTCGMHMLLEETDVHGWKNPARSNNYSRITLVDSNYISHARKTAGSHPLLMFSPTFMLSPHSGCPSTLPP